MLQFQLDDLDETERLKIVEVLERDLLLQRAQEELLSSLKREIDESRAINALTTPSKAANTCLLCGLKFSFFFRPGVVCSKCYVKVCRKCSQQIRDKVILCAACYKERQYLCKSGEWMFRSRVKRSNRRSENDSSDENDYRPLAKWKPTARPVSQFLLGELKKGKWGSTRSLNRGPELSPVQESQEQQTSTWKSLSSIVLFQSYNSKKEVRRVSTSRYRSSSSEEEHGEIESKQVMKKKSKSLKRVDPVKMFSSLRAMSRPEETEKELKTRKESGGFVGPFGFRRKAATMKANIPKPSNTLRKTSSERNRQLSALISQTKIVITSPKAERLKTPAQLGKSYSHPDFTGKSGDASDENETNNVNVLAPTKSYLSAGSGGSSLETSPSCLRARLERSQLNNSTLSLKSSNSMTSLYSGGGNSSYASSVSGQVIFSLNYSNQRLVIHIRECQNLVPIDQKRMVCNPYVKTYLLPDKSVAGKRKTKVRRSTLNPTFNEALSYDQISKEELDKRILLVSVWHSDPLAKNIHIGEVRLSLNSLSLSAASGQIFTQELCPKQDESVSLELSSKGYLNISLMFDCSGDSEQNCGTLKCLIRCASELKSLRPNLLVNSFVKLYLYPDPKRVTKRKTEVIKQNSNPTWNSTVVYEKLTLDSLKEKSLELTVWHHESLRSNEFLGGLRLNLSTGTSEGRFVEWMDAGEQEVQLWRSVLQTPNTWINGVMQLRPSMNQALLIS